MASGMAVVRLAPMTAHSPAAPQLSSAPRIDGAVSPTAAARTMPIVSSVRRHALAITSGGRSPNRSAAVKSARRRATAMEGGSGALVTEGDVTVSFAAAQGDHDSPVGAGHLELLGHARIEHLLDELLALVAGRRKQVRLPAHHEVAPAHVWQPGLRPLQLAE